MKVSEHVDSIRDVMSAVRLFLRYLVPWTGPRETFEWDWDEPDYSIGGGLGSHITFYTKDWENVNLDTDTVRVYGRKPRRPRFGESLLAEMEKSWMMFIFVDVDYCDDPRDMFFADVRAVDQRMKEKHDDNDDS